MTNIFLRTLGTIAILGFFSCQPGANSSAGDAVQSKDMSLSSFALVNNDPTPNDPIEDFPIVTDPVDCSFNNQIVKNGTEVAAYLNPHGVNGECVLEYRMCTNGVLAGSYTYATCNPLEAPSCLFNGVTITSGNSVTAYSSSSVPYGATCSGVAETRVCQDGVLSGSAPYSSCDVAAPRSCLFNGQTIPSGETVTAFLTSSAVFGSTCASEKRTCIDGTLSGSAQYATCAVNQPASCLFDGQTIAHGQAVIGFASSSVAYGQTCQSEQRICQNGVLTGSNEFSSCTTGAAQNCSLNGTTILHQQSIIAYASARVPSGGDCISESRTCNNGVLSGSMTEMTCQVDVYTPGACTLNGKTIAHGSSVTVFTSSSVPNGETCQTEIRTCNDGTLSGTATSENCVVMPPVDDGSGDDNGDDDGGNNQCQTKGFIWEFPTSCHGNNGKGNGYFKSRISHDGGKTWLVLFKNRLPQNIQTLWDYMIKENGMNSCKRPNVAYALSKNKGYVVMKAENQPACDECKYVEIEIKNHGHGSCNKHNNHEKLSLKKKVMKLVCDKKFKKVKSEHQPHSQGHQCNDKSHGNGHNNGNKK